MQPILLSLPFFQLKSLTVFAFLAFFFSAFVFWKKGKEEHYDLFEIFDAFLLSLVFAFFAGRLIFVATHWSIFVGNFWSIFDIVHNPGSELFLALLVSALYLYHYSRKRKWDAFEILDFWATSVSLGLFIIYLGFFLDGSYGGRFTQLPWGIILPGNFEKTHPVQLYFAIFYFFLYRYLYRMEYQYRTLAWYRKGKKTAQSGFLFSIFLILMGAFYLITTPFRLPSIVIAGLNIDPFINLFLFVFGLITLFYRSGRSLHFRNK